MTIYGSEFTRRVLLWVQNVKQIKNFEIDFIMHDVMNEIKT